MNNFKEPIKKIVKQTPIEPIKPIVKEKAKKDIEIQNLKLKLKK